MPAAAADALGKGIEAHRSLLSGISLSQEMIDKLPSVLKIKTEDWTATLNATAVDRKCSAAYELGINAGITYTPSFCVLTPSKKLYLFPSYSLAIKMANEWSRNPIDKIMR